jgi:dTDP-4-dehydrorhamnose 3,5-epimerase
MHIITTDIPDVKLIRPQKHSDSRGWLAETSRRSAFAAAGVPYDWAQENFVHSRASGTLRALHFQAPPEAQGKFLTVVRGAIYDVALDLRRGSPSFGRHVDVQLDSETITQIWIPAGFAHGYLTLEPDTDVLYRVTAPYAPAAERGIRRNDPALGIAWPSAPNLSVNARDEHWPLLAEIVSPFTYGEDP